MRCDINRYKQQAARLDLSGIDLRAFRDRPLAPAELRCLRYMLPGLAGLGLVAGATAA